MVSNTCHICCDDSAFRFSFKVHSYKSSTLCENNRCKQLICINCVSKLIELSGESNNKTLTYICPFCKLESNNIICHIHKLDNNKFNTLITKTVGKLLIEEENKKEKLLDILNDRENDISYLQNIINTNKLNNKKYIDIIQHSYKINKEQENIINILHKKIEKLEDITPFLRFNSNNNYHSNSCNKTIKKNSKYSHFKNKDI